MLRIVVGVVALAAAPLAAATTAAQTPGTIIHALPGPQVFPESVAVDAASGRFWVTSVEDGTIFTGVVGSAAPARVSSPAGAGGRTIATGIASRPAGSRSPDARRGGRSCTTRAPGG